MRKLALLLPAAALAFSGAASAQTAPRTPKPDMTRAQAQERAAAMFARMDANRDGTLNEADRAARRAGAFDRLDTDRNGSISRAEFTARQDARAERRGQRAERRGARRGGGVMGNRQALMAGGAVTQAAFVGRALEMFDRADADRNGTVTQAERKAARDAMRQQWQARRGAARQS